MNEERVQKVVRQLSAGSSNMRTVLSLISLLGKEQIARFPDSDYGERVVARRMVIVASKLVRRRIDFNQLVEGGKDYWNSKSGKRVDLGLQHYIEGIQQRAEVGVK